MLASHGFDVCGTAGTGEDGVALARKEKPDVALIDLGLPKMSGEDVIQAIKAELEKAHIAPPVECDVPTIVITRHVAGDVEYIFAVNATPDPDDKQDIKNALKSVEATLAFPESRGRIIDLITHKELAPLVQKDKAGPLFYTCRFGPGQMRVFARTFTYSLPDKAPPNSGEFSLPDLKGLFDGLALRVPTIDVSLSDFTMLLARKTSVEEINDTFREAAASPRYQGILGVTDEELVSADFIGDSRSSIVYLSLTQVIDGDFVKVIAWYDNAWGY